MFELGPLQKEFIRALREDNIPQGFQDEFTIVPGEPVCRHCAFGVAVMTCVSNGLKLEWVRHSRCWKYTQSRNVIMRTMAMSVWGMDQIIRMNDYDMLPFPEIAARIEDNPTHYFERSA